MTDYAALEQRLRAHATDYIHARATERLLREAADAIAFLQDVLLKDRGKTNEINILTKENRAQADAIAALTRQLEEAYETCAKLCDTNAEAWGAEVAVAKARGHDPLIYEAQQHEARALAFVIRERAAEDDGLSSAPSNTGETP